MEALRRALRSSIWMKPRDAPGSGLNTVFCLEEFLDQHSTPIKGKMVGYVLKAKRKGHRRHEGNREIFHLPVSLRACRPLFSLQSGSIKAFTNGNYPALNHFQEHFPDFQSNSSSLVTAAIRKFIDGA